MTITNDSNGDRAWFRRLVDRLPEPAHGTLASGERPIEKPKAAPLDDVGNDSGDTEKNEVK